EELGAQRTGRVDVVCPGFVSDCLETLEEIAIEGRETFLEAGGSDYRYLGCLNDSPEFIAALARLVEQHVGGWPGTATEPGCPHAALARRRERAVALGAER
ncbi:MAG: ferrochelatase, partial [Betaproteobacteria bacterium]